MCGLLANGIPAPAIEQPGLTALTARLRAILGFAVAASVAAGFLLTRDLTSVRAAQVSGPELTRLLQAMAVLKAIMAAGAVWLIDWRLRYAVRPSVALAYGLAAALMAASPGVMWHLAHVVAGGVLFHLGLSLLVLLGCTDRATAGEMLAGVVSRRRARDAASVSAGGAVQAGGSV